MTSPNSMGNRQGQGQSQQNQGGGQPGGGTSQRQGGGGMQTRDTSVPARPILTPGKMLRINNQRIFQSTVLRIAIHYDRGTDGQNPVAQVWLMNGRPDGNPDITFRNEEAVQFLTAMDDDCVDRTRNVINLSQDASETRRFIREPQMA